MMNDGLTFHKDEAENKMYLERGIRKGFDFSNPVRLQTFTQEVQGINISMRIITNKQEERLNLPIVEFEGEEGEQEVIEDVTRSSVLQGGARKRC